MNVATPRLSTAFALSLLLHAALLSWLAPPAQRGRAASDEALVVRFAVPTPPPQGVHPRERTDASPRARVRPVERERAGPSVAIAENAPSPRAPRSEHIGSGSVQQISEDSRQLNTDRLSPRRGKFPGIASADLSDAPVTYPRSELRARAHGSVLLELLISDSGKLVEATVIERGGSADYQAAALRAARRLRFTPGVEDGRPVPSRLLLEFRYLVE